MMGCEHIANLVHLGRTDAVDGVAAVEVVALADPTARSLDWGVAAAGPAGTRSTRTRTIGRCSSATTSTRW